MALEHFKEFQWLSPLDILQAFFIKNKKINPIQTSLLSRWTRYLTMNYVSLPEGFWSNREMWITQPLNWESSLSRNIHIAILIVLTSRCQIHYINAFTYNPYILFQQLPQDVLHSSRFLFLRIVAISEDYLAIIYIISWIDWQDK